MSKVPGWLSSQVKIELDKFDAAAGPGGRRGALMARCGAFCKAENLLEAGYLLEKDVVAAEKLGDDESIVESIQARFREPCQIQSYSLPIICE